MGCGCKKKKPRSANSTDKEKRIKEAIEDNKKIFKELYNEARNQTYDD